MDPPLMSPELPEIPEEVKKKYDQLKAKLEILKKEILKENKKHIIGLSLLPPKKEEKDKINVLVVINDNNSEKIPDYKLKDKLTIELVKVAKKVDETIWLEIMLTSEIKEACFDSKYEVPQLIAMGAQFYDPTDLLGAIKIAEVHKSMTIKKFEKYVVSYVAAGSLFRGEKSHDIDVYIIVDDTDVKRMSRIELRDKLRNIIISMGFQAADMTGIKKQFHIQVYILTDFWESIKEAHPVIFTFLRDGVPLYDRSVFIPWRLLLKMGRIRPSPEAIDMQMEVGTRMLERAKGKLLNIVMEDLFYATLNPSQAALMLYGLSPPTPKETVRLLEEVFVKKEKILEQKYVDILENIRLKFKEIEHGKLKEIKGVEVDKLSEDAELYLKRIKKLFDQISRKKETESINKIYEDCLSITQEALEKKVAINKVVEEIKQYTVENKLPENLSEILKGIIQAKKDFDQKKLVKAESDKVLRESSTYIRILADHVQRKKHQLIEKTTIHVRYGKQMAEIILLEKVAILILDQEAKEKIYQQATIDKEGKLKDIRKIDPEEVEVILSKVEIPGVVTLKEQTFESLKTLFGKELEIIL